MPNGNPSRWLLTLYCTEELDRLVDRRAVDADLGAAEEAEAVLEADAGAAVEAEQVLDQVAEIAGAERAAEAVRDAERALVAAARAASSAAPPG